MRSAPTGVRWQRVYLPGGQRFFQVHLDADGQPDECRYFSLLDEIVPSSSEEWAFWLDEAEGVIGWPEFQAKDGKVYTRIWTQGDARVDTTRPYRNADERHWHHEPGTAGNALRGSD